MQLKAQASTEFLIIVAILFVIILGVVVLSQNQFLTINSTRIEQQAKNVVDSLSAASKTYPELSLTILSQGT